LKQSFFEKINFKIIGTFYHKDISGLVEKSLENGIEIISLISFMTTLKIATWNLERPKRGDKKNEKIISILKNVDADIFILTETNASINFGENYAVQQSQPLPTQNLFDEVQYFDEENRTTIFSKNKIVKTISTKNDFTNVCAEIETVFGSLIVYGTIIGIRGWKKPFFEQDLSNTIIDVKNLAPQNNFCLAGDFNCSFNDYPFYTNDARNRLNEIFKQNDLRNITAEKSEIDHIVLSNSFLKNKKHSIGIWNEEKKLSDHLGVSLTLTNED